MTHGPVELEQRDIMTGPDIIGMDEFPGDAVPSSAETNLVPWRDIQGHVCGRHNPGRGDQGALSVGQVHAAQVGKKPAPHFDIAGIRPVVADDDGVQGETEG